jgi:hypothetical protein
LGWERRLFFPVVAHHFAVSGRSEFAFAAVSEIVDHWKPLFLIAFPVNEIFVRKEDRSNG